MKGNLRNKVKVIGMIPTFNDEEKKVMEEIMGPTLTMLGY